MSEHEEAIILDRLLEAYAMVYGLVCDADMAFTLGTIITNILDDYGVIHKDGSLPAIYTTA